MDSFFSSKNAPAQQYHHQHPLHHNSKERHERSQHRSKRDEEQQLQQQQAEHVHGLKSAIIKTTTKLRDKSRSNKEKK
ncbi:hypothetical protein DOY81_012393 [Sarcophaga bullata]|nr:hypothetical protein DOY81_012393 [Sarcophaga bullata]